MEKHVKTTEAALNEQDMMEGSCAEPDAARRNSLTRRRLLQGAAILGASSLLPERAFASNDQPVPTSGTNSSPTLTISNTSIGSISDLFYGLSFEKIYAGRGGFSGSNTALINIMNRLGPGVVRFGGASVDKQIWDKTGPGGQASGNAGGGTIAMADVIKVNDFLTATGSQCIWGINFNGASQTPALATDEAAIVRDVLGSRLIAVEIGNEPDLSGMTQAAFATKWKQYRDAIVQRSPSMPIYAPVSAGIAYADWFMQSSGYSSMIAGLDAHYYRATSQAYNPATADNLISPQPEPNLATVLSHLKADVNGLSIPFRLAECNSVSSGNKASASGTDQDLNPARQYASALWVIDYLFQVALGGAAGFNLHCGDGRSSYTPFVLGELGDLSAIRPMFYGLYLFQMMGTGTLLQTTYSGRSGFRAYVVKNSTPNKIKVMLVNTDPTYNMHMTMTFYATVSKAQLTEMTQSPDHDYTMSDITALDGVKIGGSAVGPDNSFTPDAPYDLKIYSPNNVVKCYVPRRTACMVDVTLA